MGAREKRAASAKAKASRREGVKGRAHLKPRSCIRAARSPSASLESLSPNTALDVLRPLCARRPALTAGLGPAADPAADPAAERSTSESEMRSGETVRAWFGCAERSRAMLDDEVRAEAGGAFAGAGGGRGGEGGKSSSASRRCRSRSSCS